MTPAQYNAVSNKLASERANFAAHFIAMGRDTHFSQFHRMSCEIGYRTIRELIGEIVMVNRRDL